MALWKFKSCPRCDGDIFVDRDLYGWYEQCLQCSYRRELIGIVELGQQQAHGVTKGTGGVKTLSKGK